MIGRANNICVGLVLMVSLLFGCSSSGIKKAMFVDLYVGTNRNLVVLLPTIGGDGSHYEAKGFIAAVREVGIEAHLKVLDVKPSLYLSRNIVELLRNEVIAPAKEDGFEKIYLVGISLGGHGALQYAIRHPEDIDGLYIFAPFLGWGIAAEAIENAGGLEKFEGCPFIAWNYACNMWSLLKSYTTQSEYRKRITLGYGTKDKFARQNLLLAEMLDPDQIFTVPGGHDWGTWKKLWVMALNHIQNENQDKINR